MSKRYTDTTLYEREWFQELEIHYKSFWEYITKKCDHAGIWRVNIKMASYCIGHSFDRQETLENFNERIIELGRDTWLVEGYMRFHYGVEGNNSRVYDSAIKELINNKMTYIDGRVIPLNGASKPQPPPAIEKVKKPQKKFAPPTQDEVLAYFTESKYIDFKAQAEKFFNFYESKNWMVGKNKMAKWTAAAGNWNAERKKDEQRKTIYAPVIREKHIEVEQSDGAW